MAVISQAYLWMLVCWQSAASSPSASVLMERGTDVASCIQCVTLPEVPLALDLQKKHLEVLKVVEGKVGTLKS